MATDAEQIATIRTQALARIVEITASPKPSYSIGEKSYSWAEYHKTLMDQVAWCNAQDAAMDPTEAVLYGI